LRNLNHNFEKEAFESSILVVMRQYLLVSALLLLIPFQLYRLHSKVNFSPQVAGIGTQGHTVSNSISIGEYRFSLFGYTSPLALVTFDGQGVYDQTTADEEGFFAFNNRFSPFSPREACLSSKDQFGRISTSVCLPPFPTQYDVNIGPVLIPPTLSLNSDYYYINDEIILSGQTIPNSEVDFSVFTRNSDSLLSKISPFYPIIKPVEATSFPSLTAKSDSLGNFNLSLPSSGPDSFRLFAQSEYNDEKTPESVRLNYKILPVWMVIFRYLSIILGLIRSRIIEILIISEIGYLLYVLYKKLFHPFGIQKGREIVVRESLAISRSSSEPYLPELYHRPLFPSKTLQSPMM